MSQTPIEPILQFFKYDHLPAEKQVVSKPFGDLAVQIVDVLPRNPERTVALRKLLEAKDAAVRASFMVLLALVLFLPSLAFAQDIPAVAAKPNVGLTILGALQDVIAAGVIGLLGMLAAYLRSKQTESKAARIGLVVTEAARAAVLELDATIKPKLKAFLADGVLSDDEKAELKKIAMDLLKTKLPTGLLKGAADVFGAAFLDTYLGGKVEQAVAEKNAMAAVPPSP